MTIKANFPAIKPSLNLDFANSKVLDPRITFSRASTATYYDGKTTVKAEENLLTYSQDFDNATWSKGSLTISANTTVAPDGTTTAETMTDVAATSAHFVYKAASTLVSVPYTASVYVKQGAASYVIVGLSGGNHGAHWAAATVNLGTGSITQTTNGSGVTDVSSSIVSVGSGWYRVTVTATSSAETAFGLMLEFSDTATPSIENYCSYSYLGTGSNTAYIWGAQLEQRSTVTAYTQTTTAPITNYIPVLQTAAANVARFDHNPVTGESKGLLIEEQRTNLLTYSALVYNVINTNVVQDTVAPDGTVSGCSIVASAANTIAYAARGGISFTSGTVYTFSIYVKRPATTPYVYISSNSSAVIPYSTIFDIDAISVTAGTGIITSVGNGWYRLSVTATCGTTGTQTIYAIPAINGTTTSSANFKQPTYVGQVMMQQWGVQFETGSFPTSYIPTTSAQVTRSADSASMTGSNFSSWYRADEGTLYGEFISGNTGTFQITANTSGYGFEIGATASAGFHYNNSSNMFTGNSYTRNTSGKIAVSGDVSNRAIILNGGSVVTSATPLLVNTTQQGIKLGSASNNIHFLNGTLKRISYYPKRLSNTQLQSLTS